jgi:colicin import membrane protein
MSKTQSRLYLIISILFHIAVLCVFILSFEFSAPLFVVENSNKQDVMSAVVLGDVATSKIIKPMTPPPPPPKPIVKKEEPKVVEALPKKEAIPLQQAKEKKKPNPFLEKELLADLEKEKLKKKKPPTPQVSKAERQKVLHQQIEKTMRQSLLDEDIKLNSAQSREAQGIVNRYQALIQQAISEHWVIPPGADRKASSTLKIRLAQDGTVLDVSIVRSSGDPALDYSARAAVFKASPLPVPRDPTAFATFREFHLKAKPENIVE